MATIKSPIPGTFYNRPSPDAAPFHALGDAVAVGDVIGLVEVMKTFHEIKADQAGTVVAFLLDNEDPVDAGQDVIELA
jgi:acetyl-CoA carboxylase biotin carboxyl carrier protein